MASKRIDGLAVHEAGQGDAVVLVHGLGGTLSVWEPQAMRLAERFRVVRYDARGSGGSRADAPLSIEGWVGDLARLLDSLDIERAHLVGHSLGTLVLQHFAAAAPQRVASLALLGVNRAPPEARRAAVLQRADDVRRDGVASIIEGLLASAPSAHSRTHAPAAMAAIREMLSRQDDHSYAWSCEAMARATRPDLSAFEAPLLLVSGLADTISPPQLSRELAAERRQARLVELPDCGHWLPLEQPHAVGDALLAFLSDT
jgi:3-oxoadipate enol-lactonase